MLCRMSGPYIAGELYLDQCLLAPRFAVEQGVKQDGSSKIRAVDDETRIGVNPCCEATERLKTESIDALLAVVEQYVSMNLLRHYFSVDTLYVATKLKVLVIPFTHKNWQQTKDPTSTTGRSAPRADVNSPDLYIPVMSLVTYIVLVGLQMGWTHTFTPEVLSKTAS